jgi:hypothetical protein
VILVGFIIRKPNIRFVSLRLNHFTCEVKLSGSSCGIMNHTVRRFVSVHQHNALYNTRFKFSAL